jgi:hypothetical protein
MYARRSVGVAFLAILLPLIALTVGCTDDVVCPDPGGSAGGPYISATVSESVTNGGEATSVTVFCSADPLPNLFVVYISDTELSNVGPADEPGIVATLDESQLLWQPGTGCSLKVTTEYGFASAGGVVPRQFVVDAPDTIELGETLPLTWHPSAGADYYVVSFLVAGASDTVTVRETLTDTSVTFGPSIITSAGDVTGHVTAVAGPLPDGGAHGNVSGAGWGFFTVAYYDTMSVFRTIVSADGEV